MPGASDTIQRIPSIRSIAIIESLRELHRRNPVVKQKSVLSSIRADNFLRPPLLVHSLVVGCAVRHRIP